MHCQDVLLWLVTRPVTNLKIRVWFSVKWVTMDTTAPMFFVEIRVKHMASLRKDLDAKQAPKIGTQYAAVEEKEVSVASIVLEDGGMPSR